MGQDERRGGWEGRGGEGVGQDDRRGGWEGRGGEGRGLLLVPSKGDI